MLCILVEKNTTDDVVMCTFHWLEAGCITGVSEEWEHYQMPLCGLKNLDSRSPQDSQPLVWGTIVCLINKQLLRVYSEPDATEYLLRSKTRCLHLGGVRSDGWERQHKTGKMCDHPIWIVVGQSLGVVTSRKARNRRQTEHRCQRETDKLPKPCP